MSSAMSAFHSRTPDNEEATQSQPNRNERENVMNDTDKITVCDKCLMASCWQGIWMCDESRNAGIVQKPRAELVRLGREHPSYLKTDAELAAA
jgi:hypothetical protein